MTVGNYYRIQTPKDPRIVYRYVNRQVPAGFICYDFWSHEGVFQVESQRFCMPETLEQHAQQIDATLWVQIFNQFLCNMMASYK